jgi:type IV pilus assembly protein PilM
MNGMLTKLKSLFEDPPPEFAFEIAADGIAMSRTRPPAVAQHVPIAPGVIVPSPLKDNVTDPEAFAEAVRKLVPPTSGRGRRTAALILPDNSIRLAVADFESIPAKEEERLALVKFRLRKTLPFDIDEAALSYHVQHGNKVVAAITPSDIVARYEAPFRAAGLDPGFVTSSSLALLELLPVTGSLLVAHRGPGSLTVLAVREGVLTLARSLELTVHTEGSAAANELAEISADLYPTLVYIEDQTGSRPEKLILAGFGATSDTAAARLSAELDLPAEALDDPYPGLAGYLKSLSTGIARQKVAA